MKIARIDIMDVNLNREFQDGEYVKSQALLGAFPKWYRTTGVYKSLRFDLALFMTGFKFRDGKFAADPGGARAKGRANQPGACNDRKTAVILYRSGRPMWNFGAAHEIGHLLGLGHNSGGIMYGKAKPGHIFNQDQIEKVRRYLYPKWDGTVVKDPRSPVFSGEGVQKSYIGTNCLRDTAPDPVNPNKDLRPDQKTPDVLCQNSFGNTSYFCHYTPYYSMQVPTGHAICSNLHCVIGDYTECYRLDNVKEYTEGMICGVGEMTCQGGRCQQSSGKSIQACPPGQYGEFCNNMCRCNDAHESCDSDTGVCQSGCASGWTGTACENPICPNGWTGLGSSGKCYRFFEEKVTYQQAKTNCKAQQGGKPSLALVKTAEIESLLKQLRNSPNSVWIGLNDIDESGGSTWRWLDGSFPIWANFKHFEKSNNITSSRLPHKDEPYHWNQGVQCGVLKSDSWFGVACDQKNRYFCEIDNLHIDSEPNNFCPNGDQLYVTKEKLSGLQGTGDLVTCTDVIAAYGAWACAGDYPFKAMKDVCCESCRQGLAALTPAKSGECPYEEEGWFQQKDGTRLTCAQYLNQSPDGNQACKDKEFWKFCCQSCSAKFQSPDLENCAYGSVSYIGAEGELHGRTCDDVVKERGPGVCAVSAGYNISQPFDQMCCKQCLQNPADNCLYDDGKVNYNQDFLPCAEYTSKYGYIDCGYQTIRETCCKTCSRHEVAMQERCGQEWTFAFLINACYRLSTIKDTFANALDFCQSKGGNLSTPKNQRESNFFWNTRGKKLQWFGLRTVSVSDGTEQWQWIDGQVLGWADWILEPMPPVAEHCVYATSAGWGRTNCTSTKFFSCVKPAKA